MYVDNQVGSCKVTELDIESLISGATRNRDDTIKWKDLRRLNMGNQNTN
jgi:hypothetical protein